MLRYRRDGKAAVVALLLRLKASAATAREHADEVNVAPWFVNSLKSAGAPTPVDGRPEGPDGCGHLLQIRDPFGAVPPVLNVKRCLPPLAAVGGAQTVMKAIARLEAAE